MTHVIFFYNQIIMSSSHDDKDSYINKIPDFTSWVLVCYCRWFKNMAIIKNHPLNFQHPCCHYSSKDFTTRQCNSCCDKQRECIRTFINMRTQNLLTSQLTTPCLRRCTRSKITKRIIHEHSHCSHCLLK